MSGLEPILLLSTLASTGLGVAGQIQQSNAADMSAESTALQLESKATADLAQASVKAEQRRKEADALISKQRAIAAASGAGTGGSAAEIIAGTAQHGAHNSAMEIWLGQEQASSDRFAADMTRSEAKARRKALPFQVGSAVLSGVSSAYNQSPWAKQQFGSSTAPSYRYG